VLNVMDMPGNMRVYDFSDLGGPAFNVGGQDGLFLEKVLDEATRAGVLGNVRMRIKLTTTAITGSVASNGVAIIPGTSDECIILDSHVDAWFDGANDNGDGLAVMIALARHFAKPGNRPGRTLVFVASAGHHTSGISGPRAFIAMNPDIVERSVMAINIEHVAARNVGLERATFGDGYRKWVADSGETPIVPGIDNMAPFIKYLIDQGTQRYGVNFVSQPTPTQSGESGAFNALPLASFMLIQSNVCYHTTGDGADLISTPGLERMARFLGWFITNVGNAQRSEILPPTG
jgi:Zn-dependent M28 family amino/carboxypeptidase